MTAASDAGDTSLIANALAFLAYQKVSTGQPGAGEADASCRVADSSETSHTVRALLYERAAWVDHNELEIMAGRCWSTLGDARAVPTLERALGRYDDTHARDKALYLTWLAGAHIDGAEIEQAAAVTGRALALCADVASVRPQDRVAETLRRLRPYRDVSAVADVIEQAEELLKRSPGSPISGMPPSRREA